MLKNIFAIPNGIDSKELLMDVRLPDYLTRKGLGINDDDIVCAQIASFTPVKNQIGLIGAFERIQSKMKNIKLLLVGNILDQKYYDDFINELSHSSIKENVKIIPFFSHELMGSFLKNVVDISILCSLQEGCSNTILESILCKKPIIMTDVGNSKDLNLQSIKVVSPAYPDLYKLNNEDIYRISREKMPINTTEIINALLDVIDNFNKYLGWIDGYDKDIFNKLDTEYMVKKYLNMYANII